VQIVELAHVLHLGPLLARWHAEEWSHLYDDWDRDAAEAEFAAMTVPGRIPTTWVAFAGDGRGADDVAGSVTLAHTDDLPGHESVSPWLVSLFVAPQHRSRGIGSLLVDRLLDEARRLGVDTVWLFTAGQERYYLDRGWRTVETIDVQGEAAAVMVRRTDPDAARRSVCSTWCADPDFGGAYAYLRRGATPDDRVTIGGEVHPGLVIAGEATSRRYPGTTHGAWFSGHDAAGSVLSGGEPGRSGGGRVVVVGAGMAGIAAARRLTEAGRTVTVIEAGAVLGGRARTDRRLGVPVHPGAAWLHGTDGHPLAALAATAVPTSWEDWHTFVPGVGPVDTTTARRAHGELHRRLDLAAASARAGDVAGPAAPDPAFGDVAAGLLDELGRSGWYEPGSVDDLVVRTWLRGEVESLYAADPAHLSLRHGAEPYHLAPAPGGDGAVALDLLVQEPLDGVLGPLVEGLDLRLGERVERIERVEQIAAAGERPDPSSSPRWLVHTSSGAAIEAGSVVVTVAAAALAAGRIGFEPPLPGPVLAALSRLGTGAVAKAFFRFDRPFWAPRRGFWIADAAPVRFPFWVDVSGLAGAPTLCAFAVGEDARWAETTSEDERCRAADDLLRRAGIAAALSAGTGDPAVTAT
jgi:monoamine oxidase